MRASSPSCALSCRPRPPARRTAPSARSRRARPRSSTASRAASTTLALPRTWGCRRRRYATTSPTSSTSSAWRAAPRRSCSPATRGSARGRDTGPGGGAAIAGEPGPGTHDGGGTPPAPCAYRRVPECIPGEPMSRILVPLYGAASYVVFLASFLYAIAWLGNFIVPKTIDSGPASPLAEAIAINLALLTAFALQHSIMARPGFKRWWTQFVAPPLERATFVLFASLLLFAVCLGWRALPQVVWQAEGNAALAL